MRTREALEKLGGGTVTLGDGPISQIGQRILAQFQEREAARLSAADERAAFAGQGPALDVLRRRLAELKAQNLFDDRTPACARYDATRAMKAARASMPNDRGVRMASAAFEQLWQADALGVLTVGEIAQIRDRHLQLYPRSKVGEVIDREIAKIGFNTLPVAKLAHIAAQITGLTQEERTASYEAVVRANGLVKNTADHMRARAFICALANLAVEAAEETSSGSEGVVDRVLAQMAPPAPMPPDGMEAEVPHEETSEVIDQITSPNTGEPISVELGVAMTDGAAPPPAAPEIPPGVVASLAYFGQLEQFNDAMDQAPIDGTDPGMGESVLMEDPTAPGAMLEVSVAPAEDNTGGMAPPNPTALPGTDLQASLATFAVFAVRGGLVPDQPIDRFRAPGMPSALRHVADQLRVADGHAPLSREVRAHPETFQIEAWIVLEDDFGNYLRVVRTASDPMAPEVVSNGQPTVQHNMKLKPGQGGEVLTDKDSLEANVPAPASKEAVQRTAELRGFTAEKVEAKITAGEEVRFGNVAIRINDAGDLELVRGDRARVASLTAMDRVISDFLAYVAVEPQPKVGFKITALFSVGCRCGAVAEYLMPEVPHDVRCASCSSITPMRAVALQLESNPNAFPGYVLTAGVPGGPKQIAINAKRMLAEVKKIAVTAGAKVRDGQLEVVLRRVGEAELSRIRRVLTDVFGVRDLVAQQVQQHPHSTVQLPPPAPQAPAAPTYQEQPAAPIAPMPPGQPGQPGMMPQQPQQPMMQASKLPVGPGMQHVHVKYENGQTRWIPIEAANATAARNIVASFMDGTEVIEVRDSRQAQMAPPPPAPGPAPGAEMMMMMPGVPPAAPTATGAPENVEHAQFNPQAEAQIRASIMHFRGQNVGIGEAIKGVMSTYPELFDRVGEKTSPPRHAVEAVVVRIAKEVYEEPAFVQPTAAAKSKGPEPKKVNTQQDDAVKVPKADALLGPDSTAGHGPKDPKVNTQVKPLEQPGTKGTPKELGPDSTTRDPKRFDAPKPPSDGHVFSGDGWGQSWTDKDLGSDSQTGDNGETKKWDNVSKKAPKSPRSR